MRALSVALAVVLAAGSSARAEGPIVVRAGVGITADRFGSALGNSETQFGPGLQSDIGYRFRDHFAAGIHVAITRSWQRDLHESGNIPGSPGWDWHSVSTTLLLGVGAQWSSERYWLAPWIGVDDGASRSISTDESPVWSWNPEGNTSRQLAFGLAGGVDLYVDPSGHRVSAYLDVARGQHSYDQYDGETTWVSNLYVSAGIAYRYW